MDLVQRIVQWLGDQTNAAVLAGFIGVIGVALGVIAVWQFKKSDKLQMKIATSGGAFSRPEIAIEFCDVAACNSFILAVPLKDHTVLEVPIFYSIHNRGEKSSKSIELVIDCSKELRFGGHGKVSMDGSVWKDMKATAVTTAPSGKHTQAILWKIDSLHPGQGVKIWDRLSIRKETRGIIEVPVTTKDNKNFNVTASYEYSWAFSIALAQEDYPPQRRDFSVCVVNTSKHSLKSYFEKKNRRAGDEAQSRRGGESFFRRLKRLWKQNSTDHRVTVIELKTRKVKLRNGKLVRRVADGTLIIRDALRFSNGYIVPTLDVWPVGMNSVSTRDSRKREHHPPVEDVQSAERNGQVP